MTVARRAFLGGILSTAPVAGCREATREQQIAAVSHAGAAAEARAREARWSETGDRELILQAGIGALQDLGFTIEESDAATGGRRRRLHSRDRPVGVQGSVTGSRAGACAPEPACGPEPPAQASSPPRLRAVT